MSFIQVLLINVASNSNQKNGIAPIYSDGTFEYWPIEEDHPGIRTPRFNDLGIKCAHLNLRVHYDPRFEPEPTYGDVRDVPAFRSLAAQVANGEKPLLLFAATLRYSGKLSMRPSWVLANIGYYIIGFFIVNEIRFSSKSSTLNWKGHEHNAHYLRPNHDKGIIKVVVGGAAGSRLLEKPFPISIRPNSRLEPSKWLRQNFRELRGGLIGDGPWFRRTLCGSPKTTSALILKEVAHHEK
jgi:hypothetical protein